MMTHKTMMGRKVAHPSTILLLGRITRACKLNWNYFARKCSRRSLESCERSSSSSEHDPPPRQDNQSMQTQLELFRKEMQQKVAGELRKITSKRNGVVEAATPAPSLSGHLRNSSSRLPAAGSLVDVENQDGGSSEDDENDSTTTNEDPSVHIGTKNIIRQHRDRKVENPLPAVPKHILKKIIRWLVCAIML